MNQLSFRNNQFRFRTFGKLPIISDTFRPGINKEKPKDINMTLVGLEYST
jgi:hypothetical protein